MPAIYADPPGGDLHTRSGVSREALRVRRPYDDANIILGMAIEGDFPTKPMWALTPKEREGIKARVFGKSQDPLTGLLVDLASDPFVWLGLAFALPKVSVRNFWSVEGSANAALRKHGTMLQSLGVETAQQELAGTSMAEALRGQLKGMSEVVETADSIVGDARTAYLQANKLRRMDPKDAAVVQASLSGRGGGQTRDYARLEFFDSATGKRITKKAARRRIKRGDENVSLRVGKKSLQEPQWAEQATLDRYIDSRPGLRAYHDSLRRWYQESPRFLGIGDDAALARAYRGLRDDTLTGKRGGGEGLKGIEDLLGPEAQALVRKGQVSEKDFYALMRGMSPAIPNYHPLNVSGYVGRRRNGVGLLTRQEVEQLKRSKQVFAPSKSVVGRVHRPFAYHPDDLKTLREALTPHGGTTAALDELIEATEKSVQKAVDKGDVKQVFRLDADTAYSRQRNAAARHYGLYVRPIDEETLLATEATRAAIEKGRGAEIRGNSTLYHEAPFVKGGKGRSYLDGYRAGDDQPLGGFSNADVIRGEFNLISNPKVQSHVRNVVWPTVTGQWSLESGMLAGAIQKSREAIGWALDAGVEKALKRSGKSGAGLAKGLREWADSVDDVSDAVDKGVAHWFYGSTLGLNVGSIATNLFQPLVYLPGFVGARATAEGYADALKEMAAYAKKRAAIGSALVGPQHHETRKRLLQGAFQHHDLMGMTDEAVEAVENLGITRALPAGRKGIGGVVDNTSEFLLKGFATGEMFNRAVAANAFARYAKRKGVDPRSLEGMAFVRRGVEETQFGSAILNTPISLLDKRNVLGRYATARQFLGFPLRVAALPVVARRYGGEKLAGYKGELQRAGYLMRTAAVSAVLYEVGRKWFEADLSGVGLLGGVGGILRDSGPFAPFPAPPVASVLGGAVLGALTDDDQESFRRALPLLLPGGLALSKALNAAPNVREWPGGDTIGALQRQWVDWGARTPEGLVPVYKSRDGTFIGWQSAMQLAAKATGLDRFGWKDEQELTAYLSKHRQEISKQRNRVMDAMLRGDQQTAEAVSAEFERRWGWKMTVTQQDLKRRQEAQGTTRVARVWERMPGGWKQSNPARFVQRGPQDAEQERMALEALMQQEREREFQATHQPNQPQVPRSPSAPR